MFVNHTTIRRKSTRRQFQASAYGSTPEFAFTHTQLQTEVNQVKASGVQEGALPQMNPRHQQSLPRCSTTSWQRECFIPYSLLFLIPCSPITAFPLFLLFFSSCTVYFFCKIQLSSSFGRFHVIPTTSQPVGRSSPGLSVFLSYLPSFLAH